MADKVNRKATKPAPKGAGSVDAPGAAKAAQEVDVLHPEREVAVAGRVLVVREYGFREGMRIRSGAKPFFDALYARCAEGSAAPRFEDIEDVALEHADLVVWMIAQAADAEPAWVAGLDDADGARLMDIWWMANAGFFIRRLLRAAAVARASQPPGRASTPPSSVPATGPHPKTLDGLPPDS